MGKKEERGTGLTREQMAKIVHADEALEAMAHLLSDPDLSNKVAAMARIWLAGYILSEGNGTGDDFTIGLASAWAEAPPAYRDLAPLATLEAGRRLAEYAVNAGVWLAITTMKEDGLSPEAMAEIIGQGGANVDYGNIIRGWLSDNGDAMLNEEDGDWLMVSDARPWDAAKEAADR